MADETLMSNQQKMQQWASQTPSSPFLNQAGVASQNIQGAKTGMDMQRYGAIQLGGIGADNKMFGTGTTTQAGFGNSVTPREFGTPPPPLNTPFGGVQPQTNTPFNPVLNWQPKQSNVSKPLFNNKGLFKDDKGSMQIGGY